MMAEGSCNDYCSLDFPVSVLVPPGKGADLRRLQSI